MSKQSKQTVNKLSAEMTAGLDKYFGKLVNNLKAGTPIAQGTARRGWRQRESIEVGSNSKTTVIVNPVPYIGVLDTGTSRQAPRGIVQVAIAKTRK
jgi:hypothetical protein